MLKHKDQQKAQIIWDVDSSYFPEKIIKGKPNWQYGAISEEAGKFIRKLHPAWEANGTRGSILVFVMK